MRTGTQVLAVHDRVGRVRRGAHDVGRPARVGERRRDLDRDGHHRGELGGEGLGPVAGTAGDQDCPNRTDADQGMGVRAGLLAGAEDRERLRVRSGQQLGGQRGAGRGTGDRDRRAVQ